MKEKTILYWPEHKEILTDWLLEHGWVLAKQARFSKNRGHFFLILDFAGESGKPAGAFYTSEFEDGREIGNRDIEEQQQSFPRLSKEIQPFRKMQQDKAAELEEEKIPLEGSYAAWASPTEKNLYHVENQQTEKSYLVNPHEGICNCPDFEYRTTEGTCKHIQMLREALDIPIQPEVVEPEEYQEDHEQYQLMEKMDEGQMLKELRGNVLDEFIYQFEKGGQTITGLSYVGVKQAAYYHGDIHCNEPKTQETEDAWIAKVRAVNTRKNMVMWGVAVQPKNMRLKSGKLINDEFAMQKAISKATRNAIKKLLPERVIVHMINEYKQSREGME